MSKRKYVFNIGYDEKSVLAENKEEALDIVLSRYPYEDIKEDDLEFSPKDEDFERAAKKMFNDKDTFVKDFAKDSWDAIYKRVEIYGENEFKFNPHMGLWQYDEITVSDLIKYLLDKKDSLLIEQRDFVNYVNPLTYPTFFYSGEVGKHPYLSPEEWEKDNMFLFTIWCKEFKAKSFFRKGYAKFCIYSISKVFKDLLLELNNLANENGYHAEAFIGCHSYMAHPTLYPTIESMGGLYDAGGIILETKFYDAKVLLEPNNDFVLDVDFKDITPETLPGIDLVLKVTSK